MAESGPFSAPRLKPNILITGTPGTGKSTLGQELAQRLSLTYLNVGDVAKEKELYEEWDEEYNCPVLDEDRLIDELEDTVSAGGCIVDYHSCEFFPERWFDFIYVLRAATATLYERLERRGYSGRKLDENIQCEIFETILEEAKESYLPSIVMEMQSNTPQDMEQNMEKITDHLRNWKPAQ
ncbi:putative adenylate kinase isoenzyme 6 [Apostichopus japonicus]|uniref:Adenylate kinase isoenzyme 6 homolog n=1 Tax=Stichopus japonicus TaxID=307972 RepID=A0A2G8KRG0_STIJA|nr:putative adenylate kinase isoenzyme 6 [Apostichopus japonicus]